MKKRIAKKVLSRVVEIDLGGKWPSSPVTASQVTSYRGRTYMGAAVRWNRSMALKWKIIRASDKNKPREWTVTVLQTIWDAEKAQLRDWNALNYKITSDIEIGSSWKNL